MQHPDEGTIHAWLDDALPGDERAALERHVASCAECSVLVAEARGMIAGSSRIISALDAVPGGVIPKSAP
ncbi:MAG: zf-HC2 domain-containing protein, partial [Gemmatimonadaceae bacterium]